MWRRARTTLHLRYEQEVSELLGIPPHVRHGVLLPTAYFTGETFEPAPASPWTTFSTSTAGSRPSLQVASFGRRAAARITRPSQPRIDVP